MHQKNTYIFLYKDCAIERSLGKTILKHPKWVISIKDSCCKIYTFLEILRFPRRINELPQIAPWVKSDISRTLINTLIDKEILLKVRSQNIYSAFFQFSHDLLTESITSTKGTLNNLDKNEGSLESEQLTLPPEALKRNDEHFSKNKMSDISKEFCGSLENLELHKYIETRKSGENSTPTILNHKKIYTLATFAYGNASAEHRIIPSGGGLYPLELYIIVRNKMLSKNLFFEAGKQTIHNASCPNRSIQILCNNQDTVAMARCLFIYVYNTNKNTAKYKWNGVRLALLEAGHSAQNLTLAAANFDFHTRCIAGMNVPDIVSELDLASDYIPLYAVALF